MKILPMALLGLLFAIPALAADAPNGEASREVSIVAPSENTDGTAVTDLALLRLFWGFAPGDYAESRDIPYTTAGGTLVEPVTVTITGQPGDVVTVYYASTAVDESGNESAFSNEISESFTITDNTAPNPPSIQFNVPISYECYLRDGNPCSLEPLG